jgi:hypothetical protein
MPIDSSGKALIKVSQKDFDAVFDSYMLIYRLMLLIRSVRCMAQITAPAESKMRHQTQPNVTIF